MGTGRAQPQGELPLFFTAVACADTRQQVSVSIIAAVGGFEACSALYSGFMRDALMLPRGMRFDRPTDPDPARETALHKLEMHASREALSLSITPLCSRVRAESCRFVKDPVWVAICTTCCALRARSQGASSKVQAGAAVPSPPGLTPTQKQVGIEIDLATGKPRCASCHKSTIMRLDGRGLVFLSFLRPIDRVRTASVVCTFCGVRHPRRRTRGPSLKGPQVLCTYAHKHLIYPCCKQCDKERNSRMRKQRCFICKERSSLTKSYKPFLVQHHHRGRAVLEDICSTCANGLDPYRQWHASELEQLQAARQLTLSSSSNKSMSPAPTSFAASDWGTGGPRRA